MPDPSGSQSYTPPPYAAAGRGGGADVIVSWAPPPTGTTISDARPIAVEQNATRVPSGESLGSASSRPNAQMAAVTRGPGGTESGGYCVGKFACAAKRVAGVCSVVEHERRVALFKF